MCGGQNYNSDIHQRPTLEARQVRLADWSQKADVWGREEFQGGTFIKVDFVLSSSQTSERLPRAPSFSYPLITSSRRTKITTGAYLKLSPMLKGLGGSTFACLGDGSRGMTSTS